MSTIDINAIDDIKYIIYHNKSIELIIYYTQYQGGFKYPPCSIPIRYIDKSYVHLQKSLWSAMYLFWFSISVIVRIPNLTI